MIKFIVGAMIGGIVSFFFFALLTASKENKTKKQIRAEVIKEFAERLKIAFIDTPMNYYDIEKTITNLVKEMVGE